MNYIPNLSKTKTPMPRLSKEDRIKSFDEINFGYDESMALQEANRCLNCVNMPCSQGCPINMKIPAFIEKIRENDFEGAYQIISKYSNLSAVCGRVCQQELQCESKCIRGLNGEPVGIGYLERFVSDWHNEQMVKIEKPVLNGHKVAIIGAGPAGLSCASELAKLGYEVSVFDAYNRAGGILIYGIPEFRLPENVVQNEIEKIKDLGVHFEFNIKVGKDLTIEDLLKRGYESVFIAIGTSKSRLMNISGEDLKGVYSSDEFLKRCFEKNIQSIKDKTVAVFGGGNVAMDVSETAVRLGAKKVIILYRRSFEEITAKKDEVEMAIEDGIEFKLLTNPIEIIGDEDDCVNSVKCVKMELGEPDESGRRKPIQIDGSEFIIDADIVVECIGSKVEQTIKDTTNDIEVNSRGEFVVDETLSTTKKGVFAGGDAVSGAATVVRAMRAGRMAAKSIDDYILNK